MLRNYDNIAEHNAQRDRRADRQNCYINIARHDNKPHDTVCQSSNCLRPSDLQLQLDVDKYTNSKRNGVYLQKMAQQQNLHQRLVDLQNETLKRENEMLTREITELRVMYNELKQSLDEAVKTSAQPSVELGLQPANSGTALDTVDDTSVSEMEEKLRQRDEQLKKTVQQLSETRKQLSDIQERLTVSEQVTIATQRRELQQERIHEKLLTDNVYEKLRPELTDKHFYDKLQSPSQTGWFCNYRVAQNVREITLYTYRYLVPFAEIFNVE